MRPAADRGAGGRVLAARPLELDATRRTFVAIAVALALAACALASAPGEGRFGAEGAVDLQGVRAGTFTGATIVLFTTDPGGFALDFASDYLNVERTWAENVYLEGAGPVSAVSHETQRYKDDISFVSAEGSLSAITVGPQPSALVAYGPLLSVALAPPRAAELEAAAARPADPFGNDADVQTNGRPWWRPDVDVPVHLSTFVEDAVLTLTGDFDLYLFQADFVVNGESFRTGVVQNGPGQARVERDILHFRNATLSLRASEARILAEAVDADLAGTLRFDEASGYYEEEGTRWEGNAREAQIAGTFRMHAEVVDEDTVGMTLSGAMLSSDLPARLLRAPVVEQVGWVSVAIALAGAASYGVWFLYSRIPSRSLLDNPTRRRIVDVVQERPGIHLRELVRAVGRGRGNVLVNVHRLTLAGFLRTSRVGRYVAIFPNGHQETRPIVRSPLGRRIVELLAAEQGLEVQDLQRRLGISRQLLAYHLRSLEHQEIIVVAAGSKGLREARLR